ncbi:PadR family transcriptional regulator [Bacillus sp. WMMC1349]|uniref:PadR family transcriptional regulator n=1 Tax=Bacillus sp. WMMC1349 TaxID=2736254 RepID=UPI0015560D14|nr:PadR family transcriptional regulator [Bacillus sp. WMMC1349]NPC91459.1 PadR family transcriptional regulator [Bacillus sp. WMMC1349]
MKKFKSGRHTAAFILLFLAESPNYGGQLLKMCEERLYANTIDSAILYRMLNKLEKEGAISSYWETVEEGQPRKWYKLNALGRAQLSEFYDDIVKRQRNFDLFLIHYKQLMEDEQ